MYSYYLLAVFTVVGYSEPIYIKDTTFIEHSTHQACVDTANKVIPAQVVAANEYVIATATYHCIPVRLLDLKQYGELPKRECSTHMDSENCLRALSG